MSKRKDRNRPSTLLRTLGISVLILVIISLIGVIGQAMNKPEVKPTPTSTSYAFTQLGQACSAAVKNYDAHISDLKNANNQANADLDKALQAVKASGSTDPSIYASYNSLATNTSATIAQNNTKIDQLSDRRAQVGVCVDKANAQENFSDSDVSNFRTLIAESGN